MRNTFKQKKETSKDWLLSYIGGKIHRASSRGDILSIISSGLASQETSCIGGKIHLRKPEEIIGGKIHLRKPEEIIGGKIHLRKPEVVVD